MNLLHRELQMKLLKASARWSRRPSAAKAAGIQNPDRLWKTCGCCAHPTTFSRSTISQEMAPPQCKIDSNEGVPKVLYSIQKLKIEIIQYFFSKHFWSYLKLWNQSSLMNVDCTKWIDERRDRTGYCLAKCVLFSSQTFNILPFPFPLTGSGAVICRRRVADSR